MVHSRPVTYRLPDTLSQWPWPRQINPHYEEVKKVSGDWFRSFYAFKPASQRAFDIGNFSLLASLAYPNTSKEHLRIACDVLNLFFLFDDYADDAPEHVVQQYVNIIIDALQNPFKERPADDNVLGRVAQDFWARGIKIASNSVQKRFVESFSLYISAAIPQARFRDYNIVPTIEDYLTLRRLTIGIDPLNIVISFSSDLPDEVLKHPVVIELTDLQRDMIIFDNDICSYNKEQASEKTPHNIIAIVMHHHGCNLHQALEVVADMYAQRKNQFLARWSALPTWDRSIHNIATNYVNGIANWVRANNCWNFESGRYFGSKGPEIQKTRTVTLLQVDKLYDGLEVVGLLL